LVVLVVDVGVVVVREEGGLLERVFGLLFPLVTANFHSRRHSVVVVGVAVGVTVAVEDREGFPSIQQEDQKGYCCVQRLP
jgi:hypothetical protein